MGMFHLSELKEGTDCCQTSGQGERLAAVGKQSVQIL